MTSPHETPADSREPANLADAAIGLSPEQLARYEAIVDRFLSGRYFSLDEEGKVAAWNDHAEARFGWSAIEVVGEDFFEYVATGSRDELLPTLRGERGDPAGCELELVTKRRDGATVQTHVALAPIRVGDGYPLNKVLQDVVTHRGNPVEVTRMKKRHADVLRLIVTALDGGEMPDPLGDDGWQPGGGRIEQRWQPAGALVVFDGADPEVVAAGAETAMVST